MLVLMGGNIIADDEFKELRDQSIKRRIGMQLKLLIKKANSNAVTDPGTKIFKKFKAVSDSGVGSCIIIQLDSQI